LALFFLLRAGRERERQLPSPPEIPFLTEEEGKKKVLLEENIAPQPKRLQSILVKGEERRLFFFLGERGQKSNRILFVALARGK